MTTETSRIPRSDRALGAATQSITRAHDSARRVAASEWVTGLARIGYATRGFLYVVVGLLALEAATGSGGQLTGTKGAVTTVPALGHGSLSTLLLALVTIGLVGYSLWGLVRATVRPAPGKTGFAALTLRLSYLTSCIWYASLVPIAAGLLLGRGSQANREQAQTQWANALLDSAVGRPAILVVGALCFAFAAWQGYEAITAHFRSDFKGGEMSPDLYRWAVVAGRAGYTARGTAFAIIGGLLIHGALHRDAGTVKGTEGALLTLQAQPHGLYLLGLMGMGLLAFGLYSLLFSRYAHARGL